MSAFWTTTCIGGGILALAIIAYTVIKKPRSYDGFVDDCICYCKGIDLNNNPVAIIVIKKDGDFAIPYLYRKYLDNSVKKLQIKVKPIQVTALPEDVQLKLNTQGETIIKTLK